MERMIKKIDRENKFFSVFDPKTGFYIRSGIIENGKDTHVDPFMTNFPELLDIGIMGQCKNAHNCTVGCYQGKGLMPNMPLDDFESIIDQSKGKVYQCALGGNGSPNEHEYFHKIVRYANENNVVPSYTTSGIALTDEEISSTKKYCGAVAVSWYRQNYTYSALERFIEAGVKTNIHYVLGNDSIDEAIDRLSNNTFPKGINAVIFLLYKPVGCIKQGNVLQYDDPKVKEFFELIDTDRFNFKVGLDACCVPALMNYSKNINIKSTSPCDGGSFSAYITPDMYMLPCSFDTTIRKYAVDLRKFTLTQAWNSEQFNKFRDYHRYSCKGCTNQNDCRGGCPLAQEINLCDRKEKYYYEV